MKEVISAPRQDRQFAYSRAVLAKAVRTIDRLLHTPRADEEAEPDFLMGSYCLVRIRERIASTPPGAADVRETRPVELEFARAKSKSYWSEENQHGTAA